MINSFKRVPVQLFRVNNGATVKLRDYALRKSSSYDILTDHGRVIPKALDPSSYSGKQDGTHRKLYANCYRSAEWCVNAATRGYATVSSRAVQGQ